MSKNSTNQTSRTKKRNDTAAIIAQISDKSPRLVRMVINENKVENDPIVTAAVVYEQHKKLAIQAAKEAYEQAKSPLLKEAEETVPF